MLESRGRNERSLLVKRAKVGGPLLPLESMIAIVSRAICIWAMRENARIYLDGWLSVI